MPDLHETINQFLEGSIASIGRDPVIESKSITANGTYTAPEGVDGFSPITVNVPIPTPVIESKSITANGTYTAPEGVDGYSPVIVNVQSTQPVIESKTITENGTYVAPSGVDGYSPITVNVPLPQNAYLLKSVTTPTPIASFNDGEEMVMPTLKVAIEPQQEGSGDPSPTNVRPISGWTECEVEVAGKNHCGELEIGTFAESSQSGSTYDEIKVYNGARIRNKELIPTFNNNIVISCDFANYQYCFCLFDANKKYLGQTDGFASWRTSASTPSTPSSYIAIVLKRNDGATITSDDLENCHLQVELGSTPSTYAPYNGATYTIDLDGTCYGGELDVVNGIVTPAPYYASYNGETLTGEWISDRDKYEVGATPTIGAQVVNIGASSTPVSILPTAIKSLRGVNNVYANTGGITDAEYFSKEG